MSENQKQSHGGRIGIFIDVQNMFYSAKILHQSKVDYGRLLKDLTGDRQLVRAIAYIVQKPEVNQSGFHEALSRFGYDLKIKELKISQRNDGSGGTVAKGSWDVGLTIDVMMMAPKLDTIVLVTGDGEYLPLVEAVKVLGCRVELVSFERSTSGGLIRAADYYTPITESWIFKEKKFEQQAAAPTEDGNGNGGLLGSTAAGQIHKDALPKDEEVPVSAGTYDPEKVAAGDDDGPQPTSNESSSRKKKFGLFG
jgi:uncharacterized LabA/DUF88 family protein